VYDITILVCALVGTGAALITILPLLGVDIRLFGRSDKLAETATSPKGRREKRLWIAVALAVVSVALSGTSFYRFQHPRIVEKTVEKPVDRVVEKVVQKDCPKPVPISKAKKHPDNPGQKPVQDNSVHMGDGAALDQNSNGDCSPNIVGGSNTVNCGPPPPHIEWSQVAGDPLSDGKKTVVVSLKTDHSIEIPAFIAECSSPCSFVGVSVNGGYMQPASLVRIGFPEWSGFVFIQPRPLGAGVKVRWTISSRDGEPVTIKQITWLAPNQLPEQYR
jgi:hypothetical protein